MRAYTWIFPVLCLCLAASTASGEYVPGRGRIREQPSREYKLVVPLLPWQKQPRNTEKAIKDLKAGNRYLRSQDQEERARLLVEKVQLRKERGNALEGKMDALRGVNAKLLMRNQALKARHYRR